MSLDNGEFTRCLTCGIAYDDGPCPMCALRAQLADLDQLAQRVVVGAGITRDGYTVAAFLGLWYDQEKAARRKAEAQLASQGRQLEAVRETANHQKRLPQFGDSAKERIKRAYRKGWNDAMNTVTAALPAPAAEPSAPAEKEKH